MNLIAPCVQDGMQICRNGHVITALLHTFPEQGRSHCERCGAPTVDRCQTCGQQIPGAVYVPVAAPIGARRPPEYCSVCGAAFPWTARRPKCAAPSALAVLESLLRRLPLVVRQLRDRHGDRPSFRVADEYDLEDLVRALLPLHFDDVRYERRTPRYTSRSRTDFWLAPSGIALTVKRVSSCLTEQGIGEQLTEDVGYYRPKNCRALVACVFDPEKTVRDPGQRETEWAGLSEEPTLRPVVAS